MAFQGRSGSEGDYRFDGVAAVGAAACAEAASRRLGTFGTLWWPGFAFAALTCGCLLARHRHPGQVVIMTTVATALVSGAGKVLDPLLLLPVIVTLYELTLRSSRRATRTYGLLTILLLPQGKRAVPRRPGWS